MTRQEYLDFHRQCCNKMIEVTIAKNNDYAGFEDDSPFANFTVVERVGVSSTEQGFLTRMMDKFSRINTFVKKGVLSVSDESVQDTLIDLANYSILLAGYIKSKRDNVSEPMATIMTKYVSNGYGLNVDSCDSET